MVCVVCVCALWDRFTSAWLLQLSWSRYYLSWSSAQELETVYFGIFMTVPIVDYVTRTFFVAVVSSYGRQPSEMLIHSLRTWLFVTNLLWLITHKPLFIDRYCSSIITRGRYTVILILDFSRFCPGDYSKSGPGEGFPVNIIHSYPGLHKTSRNKDLGYSLDVTRSPSSAHGLIYQGFPIEYQQLICWICTSLVIPESKFL